MLKGSLTASPILTTKPKLLKSESTCAGNRKRISVTPAILPGASAAYKTSSERGPDSDSPKKTKLNNGKENTATGSVGAPAAQQRIVPSGCGAVDMPASAGPHCHGGPESCGICRRV